MTISNNCEWNRTYNYQTQCHRRNKDLKAMFAGRVDTDDSVRFESFAALVRADRAKSKSFQMANRLDFLHILSHLLAQTYTVSLPSSRKKYGSIEIRKMPESLIYHGV